MRKSPSIFGYGIAAVSLLVVPFPWIIAWFVAVIVHELGHYIALKLCGVQIYRLRMSSSGLQMETASMTNRQELLCSIAGPISGLSLLFFSKICPRIAICATIQSIYNLLPIYPLDGGRCIRCILQMTCKDDMCIRIEDWLRVGCCFVIGVFSCHCIWYWKLGLLPILLVTGFIFKRGIIKTPCKAAEQIVQ